MFRCSGFLISQVRLEWMAFDSFRDVEQKIVEQKNQPETGKVILLSLMELWHPFENRWKGTTYQNAANTNVRYIARTPPEHRPPMGGFYPAEAEGVLHYARHLRPEVVVDFAAELLDDWTFRDVSFSEISEKANQKLLKLNAIEDVEKEMSE